MDVARYRAIGAAAVVGDEQAAQICRGAQTCRDVSAYERHARDYCGMI